MSLVHLDDSQLFFAHDSINVELDNWSVLYLYFPPKIEEDWIHINPETKDPFLTDLQSLVFQFPKVTISCLNTAKYPSVIRALRKQIKPRISILPCLLLCHSGRIVMKYDDFTPLTRENLSEWLTIHVPASDRRIRF